MDDNITSASTLRMGYSFALYPNPAAGELNVDLSSYLGKGVRIEVYSSTGKLLQFAEVDEVQTHVERLDLSAFAAGVYLVKVKTDDAPDAVRRVVV